MVDHKATWGTWCLALVLLAAPALAAAQEHEAEPSGDDGAETHGHEYHPNEIAVFFGETDEPGHDPQFTLGVEYERRLSQRWGVGALVDYAGGGLRNTVVAVPVFWHPGERWILLAAPGVEAHDGRGDDGHGGVDEDETFFVFRLGTVYLIPLAGSWKLAPAVNLDLVDGEKVWVYGANVTFGW